MSDNQAFFIQMEVQINRKQPYQSYLLRLWQAEKNISTCGDWRASLENPHTGEILNFSSLERLFEFLADQCRNEASSQGMSSVKGALNG